MEDIDHSRTKTKSPQTNGICERFHKTVLNEFYRIAFRKKVYRSIDELQSDLDVWICEYNEAQATSRPLVLWQDTDADILGCDADDEGKDDRSLTASDKNKRSLLTEKNHPSGSTTTSRQSFDTSMPP